MKPKPLLAVGFIAFGLFWHDFSCILIWFSLISRRERLEHNERYELPYEKHAHQANQESLSHDFSSWMVLVDVEHAKRTFAARGANGHQ
ncbi:hypothetical protein N8702_00340 [Verrucomicrobia bacterium]|nr:hypothetical protein [bacterium]MDA7660134.1 hypothetical protein [Verrucomicrobiota bacterium]